MLSRRNFLKKLAFASAAFHPLGNDLYLRGSLFSGKPCLKLSRSLDIYDPATGEQFTKCYFEKGLYSPAALAEINYLLRCPYTNKIKSIGLSVLDLLSDIQEVFGGKKAFVISGYRSALYNEYLRNRDGKASRNSLHQNGIAIDFRIPGIDIGELSKAAKSFLAGGVGTYPDFIHVDTGPIRYW